MARESDFGYNDIMFTTITHLGHLLKAGDTALGYDLSNLVMDIANERRFSELPHEPQEIILVKKSFEKTREKKRKLRRQRRPRRGRGTEDGFDDTRGAATSDTVGDTKPCEFVKQIMLYQYKAHFYFMQLLIMRTKKWSWMKVLSNGV